MHYFILILVGLVAGLLTGSVGFGGGMVILPVLTSLYGIEVAVPSATIAQLMSNLSKVVMGWKKIEWRQVGRFLIFAAPLTALGAYGFAVVDKQLATRLLCIFLILFAILKLAGKIQLPAKRATMMIGGGVTGLINGLLGVSGPLSSAVFLTLQLSPVAYIASEATAALAMHTIKTVVYNRLGMTDLNGLINGAVVGCAMMIGNFAAMRLIGKIDRSRYQKIVVAVMIAVSVWLFFTV